MNYALHYDIIGNTRLITYRPEELEELAEKLVVPEHVQQAIMNCYDSEPYYPPVAIFKFFLLFTISTFRHLTAFYRWAKTKVRFLEALGFDVRFNFLLPSYKTIWHFKHFRIGESRIHWLFRETLKAVLPVLNDMGLDAGSCAIIDAVPIESTTSDECASYNGHYKMTCYLWHRLICANTSIPLDFDVTTGSINEGHIGPAIVLRAIACNGAPIKELLFDIKYAFTDALATYWIMGVDCRYRIAKNWRISERSSWQYLLNKYHRSWKHIAGYQPGASHKRILYLLAVNGFLRLVGSHLRRLAMLEYCEASDTYLEQVSLRSRIECSNGYAKRIGCLPFREFRGLKSVTVHIGFYETARLIIAYSCAMQLRHTQCQKPSV